MELLLQSITSKSNPKIVRTAKYADKKHRDQDRVFVCEGIKLLEETPFITTFQRSSVTSVSPIEKFIIVFFSFSFFSWMTLSMYWDNT